MTNSQPGAGTTTKQRIDALRPGQRITLSESCGVRVVAERSGNGRTARIVRETIGGFSVIHTASR